MTVDRVSLMMGSMESPSSKHVWAFAGTALVASALYSGTWTYESVRLTPGLDPIRLFVVGCVGGLPVSIAATVLFALPALLLVRKMYRVTLPVVVSSGMAIGICVASLCDVFVPDLLSVGLGVLIGGLSGLCWWWIAE
jgi:hypothetical protein